MQNSAKKLRKNTIIYINNNIKKHFRGGCPWNIVPPWYKTLLPYNIN